MRVALAFALPLLIVFVATGAVAIFVFDYFEHAWGRVNSLQVYAWVAALLAVVAGVGAWSGVMIVSRYHPVAQRPPLLAGIIFAFIATALVWASGASGLGPVGGIVACLGVALAFSALWSWRHRSDAEG